MTAAQSAADPPRAPLELLRTAARGLRRLQSLSRDHREKDRANSKHSNVSNQHARCRANVAPEDGTGTGFAEDSAALSEL